MSLSETPRSLSASLDSLTLRGYVAELRPLLEGAFLQKFSQLSDHDYRLTLRQPAHIREQPEGIVRTVLIRLLSGHSRIWLGDRSDSEPAVPPKSFAMLVRKFARGRVLERFEQVGLERILELRFRSQLGVRLVVELLDRHPNLLLVREEDGKVLGGHRLGNLGDRFLRPGLVYQPPARPELPSADHLPDGFLETLRDLQEPLDRCLSSALFGLPLAGARALIERAGLVADELPANQQLDCLAGVWEAFFRDVDAARLRPGLTPEGRLVAFRSARDLAIPSLLAAETQPGRPGPGERLAGATLAHKTLQQKLAKARQKVVRQQEHLRADLARLDQVEQHQKTADLLMFHKDLPVPADGCFQMPDWDGVGVVEVRLEPGQRPRQAAQTLYKKAAKYRRSGPILQARLLDLRQREEALDGWMRAVEGVEDAPALARIAAEFEGGPVRAGRPHTAASEGPRKFRLAGFLLLVGRNSRQNERLTFQVASRDDLWLHARDFAGSHVIVRTAGRLADPEVLEGAAVLAARHSRGAEETRVTVVCTAIQRVRRAGPAGKVLYEDEVSLVVDPRAAVSGLQSL